MNVAVHNLRAVNANRQFQIVNKTKVKSMEKLSSGYKINRAADDAAGLSISEKMRRQIRGLTQGVQNTEDGISLCQVADGALNEVADILQRMNELSVQAANGTLSVSDRKAVDEEVTSLKGEINRISKSTKFNELILFDGEVSPVGDAGETSGTETPPVYVVSSFPAGATTYVDAAYLAGCASTVVNGVIHYTLGSGIYQIDSSVTNAVFELSGETAIKNSTLTDVAFNCAAGTHLYADGLKQSFSGAMEVDAIKFNGTGNTLTYLGGGYRHYKLGSCSWYLRICWHRFNDRGIGKIESSKQWGRGSRYWRERFVS